MANMSWRKENNTAVLSMDNGENRHNPSFIAEFLKIMDEIEADPQTKAVIITSSDSKNWSQGIDLDWIMGAMGKEGGKDEVRQFMHGLNDMFKRLLTFPMPVIAAMNGHAFGDGAIMACACDYRMMKADRGFFCFPEVDINIPFMPGMLACVRSAIPQHFIDFISLTGKRCTAQELLQNHVIVRASENADKLMQDALEMAALFDKNRPIFAEMKRRQNRHILEIIEKEDPPLIQELKLVV